MPTQNTIQAVGIMSGTSLDGVDYVLCKIENKKPFPKTTFLDHAHLAFPEKLRQRLMRAAQDRMNASALSELHYDLGETYASQLQGIVRRRAWKLDLIGLHGQTIYHRGQHATLQIGEVSFLNQRLGKPAVSQFRSADVALGGHGAPLAPFFHQSLLVSAVDRAPAAFHNLGGISNLTYVNGAKTLLAFDTGPANMPMDLTIQAATRGRTLFDRNGGVARSGLAHPEVLRRLLKTEKYILKKPPKSCGREEFGEAFLQRHQAVLKKLSLADRLCTLTEFTAMSIAENYRRFLPRLPVKIFVSGGGARNDYLMSRIRYHLPECEVQTSEELGWPVDAIEGGAFAYLAACHLWRRPLSLPPVTGARAHAILGQGSYPASRNIGLGADFI